MDALVAFVLVFGTIAGLELLDRTNFALITLASREPPLPTWLGATSAFGLTTVISVAIGGVVVELLRPDLPWVRLAGGILLLAYAGYLLIHHGDEAVPARAGRSAFSAAFLLIFLLELGDTTMLFTVYFIAQYSDPLLVGAAAFLGLAAVAASACLLGPRLGARVEPKNLEKVVIVVLTIVGVLTIAYAVDPGALPAFAG